jgi:hypothetical protein
MIPVVSHVGSLLAGIWSAYTRPELDRASEASLDVPDDGEPPVSDPKRIAEDEAVYLAILNGPVPF